ncbi:MAG TPA: LamG-like jellyroll fold domain-containing protein, partial [Candidatus Marinimicrobia bacterium]|nr:LamG-like jellyroll fold domain-containing protein [Candidatus Neomarinimicrobiota bacterium]
TFTGGTIHSNNAPLTFGVNYYAFNDLGLTGTPAEWLYGNISQIRISNNKRYDSNFSPNTTFSTDANTVGYWNFNAGTGTTLYDHSGNQNHGIINGATWVENIYGCTDSYADNYNSNANVDDGSCAGYPSDGEHSLSFDGTDDKVSAMAPQISSNDNITVSAWVKPDELSNSHTVIGFQEAFNLKLESYKISVHINTTNGGWFSGSSSTDLILDKWSHIAASYDGNTVQFYLNGVPDGNFSKNGNLDTSGGLSIGSRDINSEFFDGVIDDVMIWNSVLTASEITALYYSGSTLDATSNSGVYTSSANLIGYWRFDENSGTTSYDLSGNGNHGTINGATYSTDVPLQPATSFSITGTSGFRMLSSPVSGTIYADLLEELWTQGMAGSDDPNNGGANVWTRSSSSSSWQALTDLDNDTYTAGDGILVYVFADADFNGVEDDLPLTLSIDGAVFSGEVSTAATETGFHLLGNPYSRSLDISVLMGGNSEFDPNIYIWDNATSAYRTHNEQAGDIADGLLAPFQGFWVEADAGADTFTFNMATISDEQGTNYRTTTVDSTGSALITFTSSEHASSVYLSFTMDGQVNDDPADAYRLMPLDHKSHLT